MNQFLNQGKTFTAPEDLLRGLNPKDAIKLFSYMKITHKHIPYRLRPLEY